LNSFELKNTQECNNHSKSVVSLGYVTAAVILLERHNFCVFDGWKILTRVGNTGRPHWTLSLLDRYTGAVRQSCKVNSRGLLTCGLDTLILIANHLVTVNLLHLVKTCLTYEYVPLLCS
jgi:hypothetical protein